MALRELTSVVRASPWTARVARVIAVYAAARLVTTALFLLAASMSGPSSRFGAAPSLAELVGGWDGQWYWQIAAQGYPTAVPTGADGAITENAWAFMPVFPWIARAVGAIPLALGVDAASAWAFGSGVVSLVAGGASAWVLYLMARDRVGESAALWGVVLFSFAPLAALFQVAYAESLFLLVLLLALRCLQLRSYAWLFLLVPLLAFTRPGVLAFSLLLVLYGVVRVAGRSRDPFPRREVLAVGGLAVLAGALGLVWPAIAGAVTGVPDAYLQTELAWRRSWIGAVNAFVPFSGWFEGAQLWFGEIWDIGAGWGIAAAVLIPATIIAVVLWEPHVRRLGVEVRLWAVAYVLYLTAVFFPQSSIFRLLFPLSPLWPAVAAPASRWWRWTMLGLCLLGQWWWIWNMYGLGASYVQIP